MAERGRQAMRHTITDYATIEAHSNGEPVYAFGYTYVYGVSPDIDPSIRLQRGNNTAWRKIRPKKSWEISSNKLGSTPAREPKTAANDDQPYLAVHLIDGDPQTVWCSRGQVQPDVEPVWIRIDLPVESVISAVALVPHAQGFGPGRMDGKDVPPAGQALPRRLTIKISRDAWHWDTVYDGPSDTPAAAPDAHVVSFAPTPAKQVWIIGQDFPRVLNFGHCFSLAGVEVRDEHGDNLALIGRGAGVTVSSTHTGYGMDRFTQDMLWPIQYDLGYKWSRVGYDMGVFTWAYVEREKGHLQVDERADQAITEAAQNGINFIMCLDKGNWLYAPQPKQKDRTREPMETYYDRPPEPIVDPAYLEAYLNYVRYMVRHFKDRVRYFEIMNEWHEKYMPAGWDWAGTAQWYCKLALAAIPVIRAEYPQAKIVAVSTALFRRDYIEAYLKEGLGPLIDVIAWHPFYQANPDDPAFLSYAQDVRAFKQVCASYGFKGEYMATEWAWSAPYPPVTDGTRIVISELVKAKLAAQLTIKHVGLDMVTLWNETFQTQLPHWSISLLRNTFTADPITPTQPEPIYYMQRTLSTVLEGVTPAETPVSYSNTAVPYETWLFRRGTGEWLLAVWTSGAATDRPDPAKTDITLPTVRAERAVGVDIINGREQDLAISAEGGGTILRGMLIADTPVIIRLLAR